MLITYLIGSILLGLACSYLGVIMITKRFGLEYRYVVKGWIIGMLTAFLILIIIDILTGGLES